MLHCDMWSNALAGVAIMTVYQEIMLNWISKQKAQPPADMLNGFS